MGYVTKDFDRNQLRLTPVSFDKMIEENNPVRVKAFIEMLDMEKLGCSYATPSKTECSPYNPKNMLKLYI